MNENDVRMFAGIPVQGDITKGRTRYEQQPREALEPLLRAVLADASITSVNWHQYTPYFNDGEPCEFSVNEPWVLTEWDKAPDDYYDYVVSDSHPSLGNRQWGDKGYEARENEHYDAARLARCQELSSALQGGHFDDVLIELFGDHAEIAVTREGITVEFYEHD